MTNKLIHMIFAATLMSVATAYPDDGSSVNGCCACPGTNECYQVTSSCGWGNKACCNGGYTSGGVYLCNSNSATSSALPTVEVETTTTATTTTIAECAFCKEYAFMRDGNDPQHKQDNDGKCWSTNEPGSSNGLHLCNACADTPGWADLASYECSHYAQNNWCANGTCTPLFALSENLSLSLSLSLSTRSQCALALALVLSLLCSLRSLSLLLRTLNSRSLSRSLIRFFHPLLVAIPHLSFASPFQARW